VSVVAGPAGPGDPDPGPFPAKWSPMSGDGFITVADGTARWGRFGAAGVLVRHFDQEVPWYFLARRSEHCHRGGTWAIPGGALDETESPLDGALREFTEEIGIPLEDYQLIEIHEDDHGGWCYWTVLVDVGSRFPEPDVLGWETSEARWVTRQELAGLELFDAFRATLDRLAILPP